MSEADGINEALDSAMRTGLMVAARIGEQLARLHEEEQRTIAGAEEQRASQLQHRFDAQRAAARAQLAPTARDDWWNKATPAMIEQAHETATAWKPCDPDAVQASERIRREVHSRYGIDVNNPGADEASVSAAPARAQRASPGITGERVRALPVRGDEEVTSMLVTGANREDRAAGKAQDVLAYDSYGRRQQLAISLESRQDREAVGARLIADRHQSAPAAEAIKQQPGAPVVSRSPRRGGKDATLQRGDLQR